MNTSSSLRWVGWLLVLSGISMILSFAINILNVSQGWVSIGTHTHSVVAETFDVLTTGFLVPVPFAFYRLYRAKAPRLSLFSLWLGSLTLVGVTILHILFVFEILWFADVGWTYLIFGAGFIVWLICAAFLAHKSGKPVGGALVNGLGASVVGFPIWTFWLGYLFASGRLADHPA
jgi:hypothetical protein